MSSRAISSGSMISSGTPYLLLLTIGGKYVMLVNIMSAGFAVNAVASLKQKSV